MTYFRVPDTDNYRASLSVHSHRETLGKTSIEASFKISHSLLNGELSVLHKLFLLT